MSEQSVSQYIIEIIEKQKSIALDVGCGNRKQKGFVGMDIRKLPNVDIVHDLEVFPYPLPDGCCHTIVASHIYEHIKPWLSLKFIDELWRIMKVGGNLAISMPYGVNDNFQQDPTHCNPANFATWQYFDVRFPLYDVYEAKPWRLHDGFPAYAVTGNMEVLLEKIPVMTREEIMTLREESLKKIKEVYNR